MLPQGRPWRSMCKGLILGTLLTSFMLLLYSYAIPPLHFSNTQNSAQYQCSSYPAQAKYSVLPAKASNRSVDGSHSCQPRKDIVFMKTHKTGSSTILNILFRFGEKNSLKFAFPSGRNDFFYPSYFERGQVEGYQPGMCFNVFCNHMRFRYHEVHLLVPADTTYVTVLRDPALLFESSFNYFKHVVPLTWKLSGEDTMAEFLRDPWHYYDPDGINSHYLRNLLFFDLGYDNNLNAESPLVEAQIKEVGARFQLVMLMEYFDESLVLLRDLLCWDLQDIVYFKLNARRDSTISQLTPELYQKAADWNQIDTKLYRYFNATFWHKVDTYGRERMARDVAELQKENEKMRRVCIEGGHAVDYESIQESALQPWQPVGEKNILGYNLKKNIDVKYKRLCRKMLTPEIQYMTNLGANLWITKLWSHVRSFLGF
ncbi:galactosylceramide sulfotransferase isoform X1 [Pleurodeles waltl]